MRSIKVNRKKSKQILAALVMGINFVNTIAPMAVAMQKLTTEGKSQLQMVKSKAKPLEYVSLPQSLEFVDDLIFGKAEAAVISVGAGQTSTLPTLASGDFMNISSGGNRNSKHHEWWFPGYLRWRNRNSKLLEWW